MVASLARPIPTGRDGEDLELGRKRYARTYLVETDSPHDGPAVVLTAPGLPAMYAPYDGDPRALCVGRYPRPIPNTRRAWNVEVEWDTNYTERNDNPLLEKPEIEWDEIPVEEPLVGTVGDKEVLSTNPTETGPDGETVQMVDKNFFWGAGILNSAGDPYDPPPTRPGYYPVVRVTRNEPEFFAPFALQYGNSVNRNPWSGLAPRQAWLRPIKATSQVHVSDRFDTPDVLYWKVRYEFILKAETWDLALLNIGRHYLDQPNTVPGQRKRRFSDLSGHTDMDLLKADGTKYADGEQKLPTFMVYRVMREVNYDGLNINLNLPLNEIRRRRN